MAGKSFTTCKDCGVQFDAEKLHDGLCDKCAAKAAANKKPWELVPCKGCNMLYPSAQLKDGFCAKCIIEGKA